MQQPASRYEPTDESIAGEVCCYCGEMAPAWDHVIPRSVMASGKRSNRPGREPGFVVPACSQCNSILCARVFHSLVERKRFVHERLTVRLRRLARKAYWSDWELEQMGPGLRSSIEVHMAKREVALDRLAYSAAPPDARWLRREAKWRESYGEVVNEPYQE